jgi:hypothetical protein
MTHPEINLRGVFIVKSFVWALTLTPNASAVSQIKFGVNHI